MYNVSYTFTPLVFLYKLYMCGISKGTFAFASNRCVASSRNFIYTYDMAIDKLFLTFVFAAAALKRLFLYLICEEYKINVGKTIHVINLK